MPIDASNGEFPMLNYHRCYELNWSDYSIRVTRLKAPEE